jgi:uncharacterized protein YfiM (DUF2279 family)
MRRMAILLLALAAAVAVAAGASAAQSPQALRSAILAAGGTQHSVHYVSVQTHRSVRIRMVSDVSETEGTQRISFVHSSQSGQMTVLVRNRTAYVRGDTFTLENYMGLTKAEAKRYGGQWISIPHTTSGYADVAAGVTLPSVLHTLYPKGSPKRVAGSAQGRKAIGVRVVGHATGLRYVETLWANAAGKPLPLEEDVTAKGTSTQIGFAHWNEPVHVNVPMHAVPISKVVG